MIIKVNNLNFKYNASELSALDNISFNIEKGECVILCGKSGCGKTTLTRLINGLIPYFIKGELSGECNVVNLKSNINKIEDYVPLIGSVFQNPKTQYFNTNTKAELAFPCENVGMESKEILKRIDECAKFFNISYLIDRNIFNFSGGEKQKVAFGTSMMLKPKILVLDEVTSNLDLKTIDEIKEMIKEIKKQGITIIMAEHRLAWTIEFADRYFFLEDGKLKKIYSNDEFIKLDDKVLENMGLRSIDLNKYKKIIKEKEYLKCDNPYLSVNNLVIGYKRNKPIKNISNLKIKKGEILCLMGNNGVGKSTLIKTLCGLIKPLSGQILIENLKVKTKTLIDKSYLVMQDVNYELFSDSVLDEVLLNCKNDDYKKILETLNLNDLISKHPMSLSGGQKQRVAIACALCSNKEIIYLDEPTSGLDRYHMNKVASLLNDLKKLNKAIVVITHDEELAATISDRIVRLS